MAIKAQRDADEIPVGMRRVCRRFERWRKGHKARLPIPEKLWALASQVAREHEVFRTAKVLRLEYGKLKRMAEGVTQTRPALTSAVFLELVVSVLQDPEGSADGGSVHEPIHTANAFDYLTELLRHAEELKQHRAEWMPWNYRETLARLATPAAA